MLGHEPLQRDDIDRLGDILSDFRELGATAARTRGSARGKRCAGAADDRESCAAPREALMGARLIAPSLAPVEATMLAPVLREIGSLPRAQGGRYPTVRSRARYVVRFGQRELCRPGGCRVGQRYRRVLFARGDPLQTAGAVDLGDRRNGGALLLPDLAYVHQNAPSPNARRKVSAKTGNTH
jgi:hypothetical protein